MAIERTPLGFQKPDGNEPIRQGNDVISANAQKAQELHAEEKARLALLEQSAGFPGDPVELADDVVQVLLTDPASATVAALNTSYGPTSAPMLAVFKQKEEVDWRDFSSVVRPNDDDFDSTSGVNQMIAEAMTAQKPVKIKGLLFCGGTVNVGTAAAQATPLTIVGASTGHTSLGPKPDRIVRPTGTTHTLMKAYGHGLKIENVTFDGIDTEGDLLEIGRGFEPILRGVFFYRTKGHGFLGRALSNATLENVGASRCGSPSSELNKAAMRLTGNSSFEYVSNSTYMANIRLERNPGTDLDLGYGNAIDDGVEFLDANFVHIEGVIDGTPYTSYKTDPLIKAGNVRGVQFNGAYLYGGGGPLFSYQKLHDIGASVADGVTFNGGTMMGHLINHAVSAGTPARLVDLVTGDNFSMHGTILDTAMTEHVRIRSTFGKRAWIIAPKHKTRAGATTTYLTDDRPDTTTARERFTAQGADFSGDVKVRGLDVGASGATVAGNLTMTGGARRTNRTVTTSQALTTLDIGIVSKATSVITLTLPASSNNDIYVKNAGTKALTVAAPITGTAPAIDGVASVSAAPGETLQLGGYSSSVGTWSVLARSSEQASVQVPTLAAGANLGTGAPTPTLDAGSNDSRGRIQVGTGTSPAAGSLLTVTFGAPFQSIPFVQLSVAAQNGTGPFVKNVTTTGFEVGLLAAPAASQAVGTYAFSYRVAA